jgi:hypothetical protein
MSENLAERLFEMLHDNHFHDNTRSVAERRSEMPTERFPSDIYILISPDDRMTVKMPIPGTYRKIKQLVYNHYSGLGKLDHDFRSDFG